MSCTPALLCCASYSALLVCCQCWQCCPCERDSLGICHTTLPHTDVYCATLHCRCTHHARYRNTFTRTSNIAHASRHLKGRVADDLVGNNSDRDITTMQCNQTVLSSVRIPNSFVYHMTSKACKYMLAIKSCCVQNFRFRKSSASSAAIPTHQERMFDKMSLIVSQWLLAVV